MTTVRQMEKLWQAHDFGRLREMLLESRPETLFASRLQQVSQTLTAAALGMIRLDELNQVHVSLFSRFIRTLVGAQEADGGWGDAMLTALCVRALLVSGGGLAVDRGLNYLAHLQQAEGIWPTVPLRRMPADPGLSAFVLLQLGDRAEFRDRVRFADAVEWFSVNGKLLDADLRPLWDRARWRCLMRPAANRSAAGFGSLEGFRPDDDADKGLEPSLRVLPGAGGQPHLFSAEPVEKLLARPPGFAGDLGKKDTRPVADGQVNAVLPRLKGQRIGGRDERTEDRNLEGEGR